MNHKHDHKTCIDCKKTKPLSEFASNGTYKGKPKYKTRCTPCFNQYQNEYKKNHNKTLGTMQENSNTSPNESSPVAPGQPMAAFFFPKTDREAMFAHQLNQATAVANKYERENERLEAEAKRLRDKNDELDRQIKNLRTDQEIELKKQEMDKSGTLGSTLARTIESKPELLETGISLLGGLIQNMASKGLAGTNPNTATKHQGPSVAKLYHAVVNEVTDQVAEFTLAWFNKPNWKDEYVKYFAEKEEQEGSANV